LAGVIAHENGHVALRHSAEQMGQANAANPGVGLVYAILGRQPGAGEQVALNVAAGAVFAKFSRDDEREADSVAVGYVTAAGINPGGLPRMFEILQSLNDREPGKVEQWFASHPMTGERITNVNRIIGKTPGATRALTTGKTDDPAFTELQRLVKGLPKE
ncbi:MAG: M48 family metalloprotease, partial [Gemmatimonadales bacterium]